MNTVCLVGRLAHDTEDKSTTALAIAKIVLAVSDNNKAKTTSFIPAVGFGHTATMMLSLKRGMLFGVEGHLICSSYKKEDGKSEKSFEVIIDKVTFLERRAENGTTVAIKDVDGFEDRNNAEGLEIDEKDLPF